MSEIIDKCNCDRIAGICIDTCHAFSSGYNLTADEGIEKLLSEIEKYIGAGVDRHEHIGSGYIGIGGFSKLLSDKRIVKVPLILETPKKNENDDRENLRKVFGILSRNIP